MRLRTVDVMCKDCYVREEMILDMEDAEWDALYECKACGGEAKRTISAPGILTSDSQSFLDGTVRPGFADLKEAAKLKVKAANARPAEKREIQKEIRARTRVLKN